MQECTYYQGLTIPNAWFHVPDGCLIEVGPHSMKFTLDAHDTRLLLLLLERQKDVILACASLEHKTYKHGAEAMGEDACF